LFLPIEWDFPGKIQEPGEQGIRFRQCGAETPACGDSVFGIGVDRKMLESAFFIRKKAPWKTLKKSICIPKTL
jgi:hypothetical protein